MAPATKNWTPEQREALTTAAAVTRKCAAAEGRLAKAREIRDAAFIEAFDLGISPYFIAKHAGVSHALVYHSVETRVCSVKGCFNVVASGGLCSAHYARQRRTGVTA